MRRGPQGSVRPCRGDACPRGMRTDDERSRTTVSTQRRPALSLHAARERSMQKIGNGEPAFDLYVRTARGVKALRTLNELAIRRVGLRAGRPRDRGDIVRAMWFRALLADDNLWIKAGPGCSRCWSAAKLTPRWIAKPTTPRTPLFVPGHATGAPTAGLYETGKRRWRRALSRSTGSPSTRCGHGKGARAGVGCGWGGSRTSAPITGCGDRRHAVAGPARVHRHLIRSGA